MKASKKHVKLESECVFDIGVIYSRVIGLMNAHYLDLKNIFHHELAPVPTSIFTDAGQIRITMTRQQ